MKKVFFSIFMLFIMMTASAQLKRQREIYSFTYAGKNYEVVKEMKTWLNAVSFAVERGGYLVEINSLEEQIAMHDAIINGAEVSPSYTYVSNGGNIAYVWIGATDQYQEGIWLWDGNNDHSGINFWTGQGANGANNGTPVDDAYYNWGGTSTGTPREPDNYAGSQHYAAIGLSGWPSGTTNLGIAGEWNDIIGSASLYFIIEYDSGSGAQNNQIDENNHFHLYPNPTTSIVRFSRAEKINSIEVYNLRGQKILNTVNNEIDLSANPKGIYFIRINDGRKINTHKVILH
jgi:hypothetical protein